jgi:hypothetical protein
MLKEWFHTFVANTFTYNMQVVRIAYGHLDAHVEFNQFNFRQESENDEIYRSQLRLEIWYRLVSNTWGDFLNK